MPHAPRLACAACLAALMAAAVLAPRHASAAGCQPDCVMAGTVVNAAGVPDGVKAALKQLQFERNGMAPADAAAVKTLAAALKAMPAQSVLNLTVAADRGLDAAAARPQASARAQALQRALTAAGVPARQVRVQAGT